MEEEMTPGFIMTDQKGLFGIGGLDLSGTKAIRKIQLPTNSSHSPHAAFGIAGDLHGKPGRVIRTMLDGEDQDSACRQALHRVVKPDVPAVYVVSWNYAVTTGRQEPMRWRQSVVRDEHQRAVRNENGKILTLPNFELIYGRDHRQLPVVMDTAFVQTHIQKTLSPQVRTLENTIRAAEIIQPDMMFNHDEPDPAACRRNFTVLRDRFDNKVIPVIQVPAHWENALSIRANAKAMVESEEWRLYESMIGPEGIIALGGLIGFSPLPRNKRGELAWWLCYYTGFERFIWLLGQGAYIVINSVGSYVIPSGPFQGERLLRLCYLDGTQWLLDATLDRFNVLHDHPDGQLLHMIQLREGTRHFFTKADCMSANLRSTFAAFSGEIRFPLSPANLPDPRDPDAIAQLRMDFEAHSLLRGKHVARDGSVWLVRGEVD